MAKLKLVYHLFECPSCHNTLRLTMKKRELKELMKGKRELVNYRIEVLENV